MGMVIELLLGMVIEMAVFREGDRTKWGFRIPTHSDAARIILLLFYWKMELRKISGGGDYNYIISVIEYT